jgi:CheY-like chemotaxis protein
MPDCRLRNAPGMQARERATKQERLMAMSKKVLLIDDDVDLVAANTAVLEAEGYTVVSANDGAAGIDMAKAEKPDLVILDVMMAHDTEGFEVSRKMRDLPELRKTPIILLTGIKQAMSLPFRFEPDQDWLPVKVILEKPVQPARLIAEVSKYLA